MKANQKPSKSNPLYSLSSDDWDFLIKVRDSIILFEMVDHQDNFCYESGTEVDIFILFRAGFR